METNQVSHNNQSERVFRSSYNRTIPGANNRSSYLSMIVSNTYNTVRSFFGQQQPQEASRIPRVAIEEPPVAQFANLDDEKEPVAKRSLNDHEGDFNIDDARAYDSDEDYDAFQPVLLLTRVKDDDSMAYSVDMRDRADYELYSRDRQIEYIEYDSGYHTA